MGSSFGSVAGASSKYSHCRALLVEEAVDDQGRAARIGRVMTVMQVAAFCLCERGSADAAERYVKP